MLKQLNWQSANWNYPTNIRFGWGRISELADLCIELTMIKPLVITDSGLANNPIISNCLKVCSDHNINATLFSKINPNPNTNNINAGVAYYKKINADGIIAIGGGSAIDAGKAIALMVGQTRPLLDFEDQAENWKRVNTLKMADCIAIPTTAGTGSEVGRAAVIIDEDSATKKIIFHPQMMPRLVLADPELTVGLPPHLTAATGIDAFVHSFEAYCSNYYHPMAEAIAIKSMQLIKEFLPIAYNQPTDACARSQMLTAAMMGATAFQKGLGAVHAIAHPLGGNYGLHHGLLNAVLLPYVITKNKTAIESKIVKLCHYLEIEANNFQAFLQWVLDFRQTLGIPHTLTEIGVPTEASKNIPEAALNDPSAASNPIALTLQDYQAILQQALSGKL